MEEVSTGYKTQLKPLFNERGEIVLLYLKDSIEYYKSSLREGEEMIDPFYKFIIQCNYFPHYFPEEDELIHRIKTEYENITNGNDVILKDDDGHDVYLTGVEYYKWATEEVKMSIKEYIESFLNYMTEDITQAGTFWISDNRETLVWFIDSPKWIKQLAKNQYYVDVDITWVLDSKKDEIKGEQ